MGFPRRESHKEVEYKVEILLISLPLCLPVLPARTRRLLFGFAFSACVRSVETRVERVL